MKEILTGRENRRYDRELRGKKVTYAEWAAALEEAEAAEPEKEVQNIIIIKAARGTFSRNMLSSVTRCLQSHPEALLLYGDEDVREEGASGEPEAGKRPWFKPDWSPDLLESCFYFGSVVILRRELFLRMRREQEPSWLEREPEQGGEPERYRVKDLSAYESWIRMGVRLAGGYEKENGSVRHVPRILFHCAAEEEQDKFWRQLCGAESFFRGLPESLKQETPGKPLLSVIIPSRDHPRILAKCLKGCILGAGLKEGGSLPLEIIIVDNGSSPENRAKAEALAADAGLCGFVTRYLYRPQEFNFSVMCNQGAEQAEGRLLLFLNDDVELCSRGCLEKMAALAAGKSTGAVGLKLYYPDSDRIQHAGITNLPMGPVHKLQFLRDDRVYYYGANRRLRNVLAVTAACLMVERVKYLEAGGFAEELRVAFNDVDFCFRLYELGYRNVCVNEEYAWHHESLSRGNDETPEKLERLLGERDRLYARHPALEGTDPYYSPFLNREGLDTAIRPAYLTAGNRKQPVGETLPVTSLRGYRRDPCLTVRVEDCRKGRIVGYGVVLGDNNACYDRRLLFERTEAGQKDSGTDGEGRTTVYAVSLRGQYRPDLEENMPDQVRVGLCGYDVEMGEKGLPRGRYRLGMAVRNRVTGLKLVNWSSRFLEF